MRNDAKLIYEEQRRAKTRRHCPTHLGRRTTIRDLRREGKSHRRFICVIDNNNNFRPEIPRSPARQFLAPPRRHRLWQESNPLEEPMS